MFYSHEVLTSRKYGVATVWLVATLGSKSNGRKINRKAILNVDVPKACQTIIDPAAPMALRLQGNLLLGVSRVYLQQCGYVLSDAQNAQNVMRTMLRGVRSPGLDPEAGKARPEQLVLQDDPSFLPDFALPPPELLADLDLAIPLVTPQSGESQSLTPFGSQVVPGTPRGLIAGLVLPSSSSRDLGDFGLAGDNEPSSVRGSGLFVGEDLLAPLADPDFAFDDDGNILVNGANPITPKVSGRAAVQSDAETSVSVRQRREEQQTGDVELLHNEMDQDLPMFDDDILGGQAFYPIQEQSGEQLDSSSPSPRVAATSTAPIRRKKRNIQALLTDSIMELRNKDLAAWNADYLKNMKEAARNKSRHRALAQAKKNAEFWVWGSGFGGIGHRVLGATGPSPFDQFYGDNLFQLCTGMNRNQLAGTKHDRDSGIDEATQEESRRVRHKYDIEEEQMGRGEKDEGMFLLGEDEIGNAGVDEVELPREASAALDDQQVFSAMPWNIIASIRGSSAVPRSALSGLHGSLHRRRGSRMVSASPLHGRGQLSSLDALKDFEASDDFGILGGNDFGMPGPSSDGAWVEPAQSMQTSFRIREALSTEGENFLAYVSGAIAEKRTRVEARVIDMSDVLQADATADVDEVLFEEILPSKENSKVVAAQGLLMVLALGTRGMLDVRQEEDFGEIGLSLTEKAKAVQIADSAEEDQGKEDQEEADEGGQFTEQLTAGSAEAWESDNDHDSLYDD